MDEKAFQATADVAATIREGARPFSTPQLQQKFNESVMALYDLLRTE